MIPTLIWMTSCLLASEPSLPPIWSPPPGARIAIVGNSFAERMQLDGQFEARLHAAFPGYELSVRNFGWSGDELRLQPRPLNFIGMDAWLDRHDADVVIGCFGMNESFRGDEGISAFRKDLLHWISTQRSRTGSRGQAPELILISPIAHENLGPPLPDGVERNFVLARYVDTMRNIAAEHGVVFVDLHTPTLAEMQRVEHPLTINGIHLNEAGHHFVACIMGEQLGFTFEDGATDDPAAPARATAVRRAILEKNRLHFQRWRPTNTEYVYGRRHEPYGSQNFPEEMRTLDALIEDADRRIWALPPGAGPCVLERGPY